MAMARTANPAPMIGLNKPANVQLRGQTKAAGFYGTAQQPSATQKRSSIPQSSGGIM